jgi:hypothetical protein
VQEEIGRYQTDAAAILARSKRISTDNRFAKTTNQERQR